MEIYVGSQHGNASAISNELYCRLKDINENTNIHIFELNELEKKTNFNQPIIIICSTTGHAEVPDNGSKFWNKIKKRSLNKDYYKKLKYLILGLGNTNYSEFCGAAKKISKRLKELSAIQLHPLVTIDDETNDYDEKIDLFTEIILQYFSIQND